MEKLLTIKEALNICWLPFRETKLRQLLRNGELKKLKKLPKNNDYILGVNIGTAKRPIWRVEEVMILDWFERRIPDEEYLKNL